VKYQSSPPVALCSHLESLTLYSHIANRRRLYYNKLDTFSNIKLVSWRFDVLWRLLQNWKWVDTSPRSVILVEMSWFTEKKLVVTGRQKVRPCVTVHTFVLALANRGDNCSLQHQAIPIQFDSIIIRRNHIIYLSNNPNPIFYQDKVENYGINVTPDKNRSRKVKTSPKQCSFCLTILFHENNIDTVIG